MLLPNMTYGNDQIIIPMHMFAGPSTGSAH